MKKTIAILLVLVIGMVGVFAADTYDTTIYLRTTVEPINQMAVVDTSATLSSYTWPSTNGATADVYGTDSAELAYPVTDDNLTQKPIAQLFARSNNRSGVTLTIDATPLVATTAAESSTSDSDYIDYSLEVGTAQLSFAVNQKTVTESEIGTLTYNDAVVAFAWDIKLKLNEALADAAAGTYTGNITFTFTTNS